MLMAISGGIWGWKYWENMDGSSDGIPRRVYPRLCNALIASIASTRKRGFNMIPTALSKVFLSGETPRCKQVSTNASWATME